MISINVDFLFTLAGVSLFIGMAIGFSIGFLAGRFPAGKK